MAESIEILIKALGDLRRPPSGRKDLGEALRAVTAAAAATIAGVECADIVLIGKDTFESHGATSSLSRELGRIQLLRPGFSRGSRRPARLFRRDYVNRSRTVRLRRARSSRSHRATSGD